MLCKNSLQLSKHQQSWAGVARPTPREVTQSLVGVVPQNLCASCSPSRKLVVGICWVPPCYSGVGFSETPSQPLRMSGSPATPCCVTQLYLLCGAHITCCDVRNLLLSLHLWLFQLESLECCSTPQIHSGCVGAVKPAPALASWCVQLILLGSPSTSWLLRGHLYQVSSSTSETRRLVLPSVSAS